MATPTFTKAGAKATTTAKLDKNVFGLEVKNHELLKQAYVAYLANGRTSAGNTKTRGEVSGGGRKPWKQKGTGRARFGSSRNPIWRGGGITFGPTGNENYSHKLPLQAKRQAIRQALSLAAANNKVVVVEGFSINGKTAEAVKFFDKIGATDSTLVVVPNKTAELIRATNNLQNIKLIQAKYINVYDVLNADQVVIASDALADISDWLATKAASKENA